MQISQAILQLRIVFAAKYGDNPHEINNGNCEYFAESIADRVPRAKAMWGHDSCPMLWSNRVFSIAETWFARIAPGHCFIKFNGKFYDSECPQGCNYPDDLPFFQRQIVRHYSKKFSRDWIYA